MREHRAPQPQIRADTQSFPIARVVVGVVAALIVLATLGSLISQIQTQPDRSVPSLQAGTIATATAVSGWRSFSPQNSFRPGDPVYVYTEALNINHGGRADVSFTVRVSGPDGVSLPAMSGRYAKGTSDPACFYWGQTRLPADAAPGAYSAEASIRDNLTSQVVQTSIHFTVIQPAQPANIDGSWAGTFSGGFQGTTSFEVQIQQTATQFRGEGQDQPAYGQVLISGLQGNIDGNNVRFEKRYASSQQVVLYTGQVSSDGVMSGTWTTSGLSGSWQLSRVVVPGESDANAAGILTIHTIPGDSEVFLDGKDYGESSADGTFIARDVLAGTHELTVRKTGYRDFQSPISVAAGQDANFVAELRLTVGKLTVNTSPAAKVIVDGLERGVADSQGYFAVYDLPAGTHQIQVRKPGYSDMQFGVEMAPGETRNVAAGLKWNGGYLTIHASPPGTAVNVSGMERCSEEFSGFWSDNPCLPGTYRIIASHVGMKTETRTVMVEPGQHRTVEITLSPDSTYARTESSGVAASTWLAVSQPSSPAVSPASPQTLLASVYLLTHGVTEFQTAAAQVLRQGGSVVFDLMHEHSGLSGDSIHPVVVTVTPRTITYDPGSSGCKYSRFTAPLRDIKVAEVSNKTAEGKIIGIVVRHLVPGTYLLHLDVRDPARSNDKVKLYFATADSYTIKEGNNVNYLASRSNSAQVLGAVEAIIRNALANTK